MLLEKQFGASGGKRKHCQKMRVRTSEKSNRNGRALLGPAAAEAAQEQQRAANRAVTTACVSPLTSDGDRRFADNFGAKTLTA